MRKIEQRMVNAINNKVNYRESNTEVIIKGANVFVRLYDTYIYMQKYVARCIFPMVVLIRLQLAAVCVRLVQTIAQITNCVAANLLAKRKCLICVITAKRQYHKTYWIGAKIVGISRLFDSVCTTK